MLGENIRHYRKLNHFSQQDLAEQLGVSRQRISAWENNLSQPSAEQLLAVAALLHVSPETLSAIKEEAPISQMVMMSSPDAQPAVSPIPKAENPTPQKKKKGGLVFLIIGIVLSALFVFGLLTAGIWLLLRSANETVHMPVETTAASTAETIPDTDLSAVDIFELISPSVVEITTDSSSGGGIGTGFFCDDKGTVITNYHVIRDRQKAWITLSDGRTYSVTSVLGYDADRDLAVLATGCTQSIPLTFRASSVKTGEKVYAIGSSRGLTASFSDGIVSAVDRNVYGNVYIQTTAPVSNGNSGGPLVDAKGEVVGVICSSFENGQNLNLAIPVAAIQDVSLKNPVTLETLFPDHEVWWISDWGFLYYAEKETYVLLFQLKDADKLPMSVGGTVKIRIVNNDNVTVYSQTHTFTSEHFETWRFESGEKLLLATIYISPGSIAKGSTPNGTVYFEVFGKDYSFDEGTTTTTELPTGSNTTPPVTQTYTCLDDSCNNTVSSFGEYCSVHRCVTPGCSMGKSLGSNYCYLCVCDVSGCKKGHIQNGYYCTAHTCAASGCTEKKASSSNYCAYHQSNTSQGGNNTQNSSPPSSQYSCLDSSCNTAVSGYGKYCDAHRCATEGCSNKKLSDSNYCYYCVCAICRNKRVSGGFYCANHSCIVGGCTNVRITSSQYCYKHNCTKIGCTDRCIDGGYYCENHTCKFDGCTDAGLFNGYCYSHSS